MSKLVEKLDVANRYAGPRWYVVETTVGRERETAKNLKADGFEVYLPMRRASPRAIKIHAVAFFPRYLFTRLSVGEAGWEGVFSAVGVQSLLGNAQRPIPLADRLIELIRSRERDGFIPIEPITIAPIPFSKGDHVKVADGPLSGFEAVFHERVDEKRALILVSFLGRDSRTHVDLSSLRAVG